MDMISFYRIIPSRYRRRLFYFSWYQIRCVCVLVWVVHNIIFRSNIFVENGRGVEWMDGQVTPFDELALESNQRTPWNINKKKWSSQHHIIQNMHHVQVCWLRLREWCGPAATSFLYSSYLFIHFFLGCWFSSSTNRPTKYIYICIIFDLSKFSTPTHTPIQLG